MALTSDQIATLQQYRDKSYVSSVLFQEHADFFSMVKGIINFPLIIISATMGILNSNFEPDSMKTPNIILNASTGLILSLISNFKLDIKTQTFHNLSVKMTRLLHGIEDRMTNDLENTTPDHIRNFINEYDSLNENNEFSLISFIKTRIQKRYKGSRTLPNSLNCETPFSGRRQSILPPVSDIVITHV